MAANLTSLANQLGSDKGTKVGNAHNYTALYSFLFEQFVHDDFAMLEIGLQRGDPDLYRNPDRVVTAVPSISMWLAFFPKAHCYGFDIADFTPFSGPRFTAFRGDLSSAQDLQRLAAGLPRLKIIVEDGSHASYHQQMAFAALLGCVEPGGFYVIEDLNWQPPIEASLPPCPKTRHLFERFVQTRRLEIPFLSPEENARLAESIGSVFIHRASSTSSTPGTIKLVVIQKASAPAPAPGR